MSTIFLKKENVFLHIFFKWENNVFKTMNKLYYASQTSSHFVQKNDVPAHKL